MRRTEHGVALVTALIVVAIVASLAAWLATSQEVWFRQTTNLSDAAQAEAVTHGALLFAALSLDTEGKNTTDDDLTQPWSQPLPLFPVAGGAVTARAEDAEGRFNLNNLVHNGSPDPAQIGVFQQLLEEAHLNPSLASGVVAWLASGVSVSLTNPADSYYLSLPTPYRAGAQPFSDASELRLVQGFTDKTFAQVRPWVTALPATAGVTPINVNTAPPEVLIALFPQVAASAIAALVAERTHTPFTSPAQLAAALPGGSALPPVPYGIRTSYFQILVQAHFGRITERSVALIYRPLSQPASILWANRYWAS